MHTFCHLINYEKGKQFMKATSNFRFVPGGFREQSRYERDKGAIMLHPHRRAGSRGQFARPS